MPCCCSPFAALTGWSDFANSEAWPDSDRLQPPPHKPPIRHSVWISWLVGHLWQMESKSAALLIFILFLSIYLFIFVWGGWGVRACWWTMAHLAREWICMCVWVSLWAWKAARGWTQRMLSGWACGTASLSCLWPQGDGHKLGARAKTTSIAKELQIWLWLLQGCYVFFIDLFFTGLVCKMLKKKKKKKKFESHVV